MRFPLYAGALAVLGADISSYDDDDINFLRLLSSNASSGNATATSAPTTQPATTGGASGNATATTAPATTAPATTAPATTAPATTAAATTAAATTAGAATNATATTAPTATTVPPAAETTVAPGAGVTELCSAAAYELAGLAPPATFTTSAQADKIVKVECSGASGLNEDDATRYYETGYTGTASKADTVANKKVCTDASGTTTDFKCSGANTLTYFKGTNADKQGGVVQFCCGVSPNFVPKTLAAVKSDGTFGVGLFSDNACSVALTSSGTTAAQWWQYGQMTGGSSSVTWTLGTCAPNVGSWRNGAAVTIAACNGTDGTAGGKFIFNEYFDDGCVHLADTSIGDMANGCEQENNRLRLLSSHNVSSGVVYKTHTCAATAPARKQFSTTLAVTFAGLPTTMTANEKTEFKGVYETKALSEFTTAVDNAAATITGTHAYTGALVASRRRLAERRQLSGTTGVTSVFVTSLPAAAAETAQAAVVTASSNALSAASFKSTIETELKTNTATATLAANVTAAVTAPVVSATVPDQTTPTTPASTSSAITQYLGFGSILVAAMMFF